MAKDTGASPEEGIGVLPLVDGKDGDEEVFVDDGTGGKSGKGGKAARADDDGADDLDGGDDLDDGGKALDSDEVDTGADDKEFRLPERDADAKREKDDDGAGKRDDPDDLDDFPTKVRKRINREVRLKHEAEDRARLAEERAERAEREIFKSKTDGEVRDIDAQIAEHKSKLKQARAELDTDAEADLIAGLSELAARKTAAARASASEEGAAKPKATPDESRRVEAWYGRNGWMADERMAWKKQIALEVNAELLKQGLKPSTDSFYEKLDEKITERVRARRKPMERSPVDGGDRSAGGDDGDGGRRESRRPTRVVITDSDKRDMRRYGLDPNNPAHLKNYAAEKAASGG